MPTEASHSVEATFLVIHAQHKVRHHHGITDARMAPSFADVAGFTRYA